MPPPLPDGIDKGPATLLHEVVEVGPLSLVQLLLQADDAADAMGISDERGEGPLQAALALGRKDVAVAMLKAFPKACEGPWTDVDKFVPVPGVSESSPWHESKHFFLQWEASHPHRQFDLVLKVRPDLLWLQTFPGSLATAPPARGR